MYNFLPTLTYHMLLMIKISFSWIYPYRQYMSVSKLSPVLNSSINFIIMSFLLNTIPPFTLKRYPPLRDYHQVRWLHIDTLHTVTFVSGCFWKKLISLLSLLLYFSPMLLVKLCWVLKWFLYSFIDDYGDITFLRCCHRWKL